MAREINNPRAATELARDFDVKGGLHLTLDEVIVPVRPVLPAASNPAAGVITVVAVAAQVSFAALRNTLDVPIEVYGVMVQENAPVTGALFLVSRPATNPAGLASTIARGWQDFRLAGSPSAVVEGASLVGVPAGMIDLMGITPIGTGGAAPFPGSLFQPLEVTLGVGAADGSRSLCVYSNTVNIGMTVSFFWREPAALI